jgi:hypothetical protein
MQLGKTTGTVQRVRFTTALLLLLYYYCFTAVLLCIVSALLLLYYYCFTTVLCAHALAPSDADVC